jgi:ABC-type microcin C transport system permease subunit YejE
LRVEGRSYWPVFRTYSLRDFGGDSPIPIRNYKSPRLLDFLNGVEREPLDPRVLYGGEDDEVFDPGLGDEEVEARWQAALAAEREAEEARTLRQGAKKETLWVWPPFKYNHKSRTFNPKSGRENLAAPWSEYVASEGRTYPGAVVDGHWLGTDRQGKDVLARIVYGFRISLLFGAGLALTGAIIGCGLGALQGYFGGLVDLVGQRLTEIWGSMPRLYLLIILSSFLANQQKDLSEAQHFWLLFGILNLTAWMGMATYMRAEFLKARNLEYVRAAQALGVSNFKIMLHHILPNSLTPIITFLPFSVTGGILALVGLDFLALGVKYPAPSLGELLAQGQENLHATWILLPTFFVLVLTLTLLTFIGDGVRDAFDPRVKARR